MAQNIIIDIKVQDGKAQAKIRGLEKSFRDFKDVLKDVRKQLKENNHNIEGTSAGYAKQITALEKLRDETAKTGRQYRAQTKEINKLVAAQKAITGPVRGTVAALQAQKKELANQRNQLATTAERYEIYSKKIAEVQSRIDKLTGATQMNGKVNEDLISSSGLAGATLTEVGRTLSDLPYGIRGVANNLSQLSTLMITLAAKTKSFRRSLSLLGKQLMGPLGLIILFQSMLALFESNAINAEKATGANEDLSGSFAEQAGQLATLLILLDRGNLSLSENQEIVDTLNNKYKNLNATLDEFGDLTDDSRKSIDLLVESLVKQQVIQTTLEEIVSLSVKKTKEQIDFNNENVSTYDKVISSLSKFGNIFANILPSQTREYTESLGEINNEIEKLIERLESPELSEVLKSFLENLRNQGNGTKDVLKEGTIAFFEEMIKGLKEQQTKVVTTSEAYLELQKEIDKVQEKINEITGETEDNSKAIEKFADTLKKAFSDWSKTIFDDFNNLRDKQKQDRKIELLENDKELAIKIAGLAKLNLSREQFEKRKQELIRQSKQAELDTIKDILDNDTLSLEERLIYTIKYYKLLEELNEDAGEDADGLGGKFLKAAKEAAKYLKFGIDAIKAQIDAEISQEERKTRLINNELKKRIINEKLSAEQKEAINNQIERNEVALQEKRDKLAEKAFKAQKAVSIAEALINTYEMATKAYKALAGIPIVGPALGAAAAAAASVFGLKQVDAIRKTQFVPSAAPGSTRVSGLSGAGDTGGTEGPTFNIVGTGQQFQLSQAIAQRTGEPVKAYVVTGDVRSGLALERNIIKGSKLG